MDSIYHIDTDIECKVFHFGHEICIAKPGEDALLALKKGRHKLSFQSTDNCDDVFSLLLEVPENDLEDFITINLVEVRDCRLKKEADIERERREIEQRRVNEEKEKARALELKRANDERLRLEEERLMSERIAKEKECAERVKREHEQRERMATYLKHALEFAKEYEDHEIMPYLEKERLMNNELRKKAKHDVVLNMTDSKVHEQQEFQSFDGHKGYVDNIFLQHLRFINSGQGCYSEGLRVVKGENGKYGYVDYDSNIVIECRYDKAFPFCYGLAHIVNYTWGEKDVITEHRVFDPIAWENRLLRETRKEKSIVSTNHLFINRKGEVVFKVDGYSSVSSFCQGICVCTRWVRGGKWSTLVGYDTYGNIVFEIPNHECRKGRRIGAVETHRGENYFSCNYVIAVEGGFYNLAGVFYPGILIDLPADPWNAKRKMPSSKGFMVKKKDGTIVFMDENGIVYSSNESKNRE